MSEQDQQIVDRITKAIEENHPGLSSNDKSKSIAYSYFALKQYQADPTRLPQKQYAVVPVVALGAYEVGLFLGVVTAAVMYQTTGEVDGLSGVTLSNEDNMSFQEAKANLLENKQQGDSIKSKIPEKKTKEGKSVPASGDAIAMAGAPVPDGNDEEPQKEDDKKVRKTNIRKGESKIWKNLKPFRKDIKTNGLRGNKKQYYQWDFEKNEIEVYNHKGNHMGAMDPKTGRIYKEGIKVRKIDIK